MKKKFKTKAHIIAWAIYLIVILLYSIYTDVYLLQQHPDKGALYSALIRVLSKIPAIMFFYLGFFIKNRQRISTVVLVVFILTAYAIVLAIGTGTLKYAPILFSKAMLWCIIGVLVNIIIDWFKKRRDIELLKKENAESQLATLRSQVNPHFLFNTLNNIDALIHKNPDIASQSLVKLSGMMRYMYKESEFKQVALKKELEHLRNYVALEQLRLKNKKFVHFAINGDINEQVIAPMLLMPFIENSFKHAVDSSIEKGIEIDINIEKTTLKLTCSNKYDCLDDKDKVSGIGLENVKKRLALIYPEKHQLMIADDDKVFCVNLEIELHED